MNWASRPNQTSKAPSLLHVLLNDLVGCGRCLVWKQLQDGWTRKIPWPEWLASQNLNILTFRHWSKFPVWTPPPIMFAASSLARYTISMGPQSIAATRNASSSTWLTCSQNWNHVSCVSNKSNRPTPFFRTLELSRVEFRAPWRAHKALAAQIQCVLHTATVAKLGLSSWSWSC